MSKFSSKEKFSRKIKKFLRTLRTLCPCCTHGPYLHVLPSPRRWQAVVCDGRSSLTAPMLRLVLQIKLPVFESFVGHGGSCHKCDLLYRLRWCSYCRAGAVDLPCRQGDFIEWRMRMLEYKMEAGERLKLLVRCIWNTDFATLVISGRLFAAVSGSVYIVSFLYIVSESKNSPISDHL